MKACSSLPRRRARRVISLCLWSALAASAAFSADIPPGWRAALPGWQYAFPRDHEPHPEFKTEWWYFTGNLQEAGGRRFGYQTTFFRQGIRPPGARTGTASRLVVNDLPFAHFCISDPQGKRFLFRQKISRGAFGEAGFGDGGRLAWIEDWSLQLREGRTFHLEAADGGASLTLDLENAKPGWTVHGRDGISQKAAGEGHASHYYSGTRMRSRGTLVLDGRRREVSGESWFDHEWATNQLTAEQAGWNWFGIQFGDGAELMLYQMRLKNGGVDPASSGTFTDAEGQTQALARDDYQLRPLRYWTSTKTNGKYPIAWQASIPRLGLSFAVETPLEAQELSFPGVSYWEGMIDIHGTRNSLPVTGRGYSELTGYAGALTGLSGE